MYTTPLGDNPPLGLSVFLYTPLMGDQPPQSGPKGPLVCVSTPRRWGSLGFLAWYLHMQTLCQKKNKKN